MKNAKRPIFLQIREKWAFGGLRGVKFSLIWRKTGARREAFSTNKRKKVWGKIKRKYKRGPDQ
jgi:hypothetical protein